MSRPLSTTAVAGLNRVLLQAATRSERRRADEHAEKLAREVARLADELARLEGIPS
jgi:hypothetical protein